MDSVDLRIINSQVRQPRKETESSERNNYSENRSTKPRRSIISIRASAVSATTAASKNRNPESVKSEKQFTGPTINVKLGQTASENNDMPNKKRSRI